MEALSEGLEHRWYLLRIVFSSDDAEIIQNIQDGISNATKFFEVRLYVVQLDGHVSDANIL